VTAPLRTTTAAAGMSAVPPAPGSSPPAVPDARAGSAEPATPPASSRLAGWLAWSRHGSIGPMVAAVGSVLLVIAGLLPVWGTRLVAPQYPKGLDLWFYGGRVEGPVREVNGLNHYIGMQPIDLSRVPEMQLWPLAVVGSALLLVVAALWRGWPARLALLGLWLTPLIVLADIQRWLIIFATELDQTAALRVGSFIPLVVGPTQVWNFTVLSYPGAALVLIWLVALAATVAYRARRPSPRVRWAAGATAMTVAVVGSLLLVVPSMTDPATAARSGGVALGADGSHDHAGHGHATPSPTDHAAHATDHADHGGHATADDAGSHHLPSPAGSERADPPDPSDLAAMLGRTPTGGTLLVPAGTYRVNLVIDRPVTLLADGHVRLDGGGRGTVVTIAADDVTMRGFHVAHTGGQVEEAAAIKVVDAARVLLEDNRLEDFFTGIAVLGSRDVRISGNTLHGSGQVTAGADHAMSGSPSGQGEPATQPAGHDHGHDGGHGGSAADPGADDARGRGPGGQGDGISLWHSANVTVFGNVVEGVRDGLYLSYADLVLLDSNVVRGSRYAIHTMFGEGITVFGNRFTRNLAGMVLMYSKDVLAGRNAILDHRSGGTGVGVALKDVAGLRLAENVIARNRIGIRAEGTQRSAWQEGAVLRNRISANTIGVSLMASADLGFAANTFEGNLTDVHASDRNVARRNDWTYQGTGNRWSAYAGYDLDGDGIGDIPHTAGGFLGVIITTAPALEAFATAPALHALSAAQGIWEASRGAIVIDHAPRTDDPAPRLSDLGDAGVASAGVGDEALPWQALGLLLALLTSLAFLATRLRRRSEPEAGA
jgi:nitrous oxidase accessory protein